MLSFSVYSHVFLVFTVLSAYASSAALPHRRATLFRDVDFPRRRYEELIASRQIRNSFVEPRHNEEEASVTTEAPSTPAEPAGSLKFHVKPASQTIVPLNGRLELACDVSGAPPPAVYWLKNGQPIREAPSDMEEATNRIIETESILPTRGLASTRARLIIDCVDGDAEAIYTCVAESLTEKIIASTFVHVEGEDPYNETVCSLKHETDLLPATIYMSSGTYIDMEGKDAVLLCRATGNPAPTVSWYDNEEKLITSGREFQVLPTGDLKIHNLSWISHMGLFKCQAENQFGQAEASTFVYPVVPES